MELMKCCEELKEREKDVNSKLDDAYQQIKDHEKTIQTNNCQALNEQNALLCEIEWLTKCVSDRDQLDQLCKIQKQQIHELEGVRHEKALLEETLIGTQLELSERNRTIDEMKEHTEKLKMEKEDGLQRVTYLTTQMEQITKTNDELERNISLLEDLESQRKEELKICRDQMRW
jgi:chromosome segregation ATPase